MAEGHGGADEELVVCSGTTDEPGIEELEVVVDPASAEIPIANVAVGRRPFGPSALTSTVHVPAVPSGMP